MTLRIHLWLKRDYKIVMNKIIIACLAFASSDGFIQVIDPLLIAGTAQNYCVPYLFFNCLKLFFVLHKNQQFCRYH